MNISKVARVLTVVLICTGIILKIQDIDYGYLVMAIGFISSAFINNKKRI